jgi:hypothetical protein
MSTLEEVREIVCKRIEDAKRKQIREKALKIVYVLGTRTFGWSSSSYIYRDNKISIEHKNPSNYLKIETRQENGEFKPVFCMKDPHYTIHNIPEWKEYLEAEGYYTLRNIERYIPGEWEDYLENLYHEVLQKISEEARQRELEEKQRKLKELKERFGIQ